MQRSYAFWGMFFIGLGVALLSRDLIHEVASLDLPYLLFGIGSISLGARLLTTRQVIQIIMTIVAGLCFGTAMGFASARIEWFSPSRGAISCNRIVIDEDEKGTMNHNHNEDQDSDTTPMADTIPQLPSQDSTVKQQFKPVY